MICLIIIGKISCYNQLFCNETKEALAGEAGIHRKGPENHDIHRLDPIYTEQNIFKF